MLELDAAQVARVAADVRNDEQALLDSHAAPFQPDQPVRRQPGPRKDHPTLGRRDPAHPG